ncbi:MAG: Hpt domain-containing protein [bacterium]
MNPVINREEILVRVDNDWRLLILIIKLFLEKNKVLMQSLREGIQTHDGERVQRAAHSLKGMAGNFTARAVIATAGELETMGKTGDMSRASILCEQLESELGDLKKALLEFQEEHQHSAPVY